jgi:hypothetical protein
VSGYLTGEAKPLLSSSASCISSALFQQGPWLDRPNRPPHHGQVSRRSVVASLGIFLRSVLSAVKNHYLYWAGAGASWGPVAEKLPKRSDKERTPWYVRSDTPRGTLRRVALLTAQHQAAKSGNFEQPTARHPWRKHVATRGAD